MIGFNELALRQYMKVIVRLALGNIGRGQIVSFSKIT